MKNLENISNSELAMLIDEWVRGLHAERNREMLKDRLINGMLFEPLAENITYLLEQLKISSIEQANSFSNTLNYDRGRLP